MVIMSMSNIQSSRNSLQMQMLHTTMYINTQIYTCTINTTNFNREIAVKVINIKK